MSQLVSPLRGHISTDSIILSHHEIASAVATQGLKPALYLEHSGTTKVVP